MLKIGDKLTFRQRQALVFQFSLPARAMTSQQLRDFHTYPRIAASNALYGKLGRLMANVIGFELDTKMSGRNSCWRSLSTGAYVGEHFAWFMRPQLAEALVRLGIVDQYVDGAEELPDPDLPKEVRATEGRLLLRSHLARERNQSLVAAKRNTASSLDCEICGFSALETYGEAYCEVHHLIPLAQMDGRTPTRLEDLAILCANCHRIIHRSNPPLTLNQLRSRLSRALH